MLFLSSITVILASFVAQLLFSRGLDGIGVLRSVWLGVITMWLVVLMAVRKRRNVAKGTVYLVVLVGLVCVYWDYLTGWRGWSLTYAVPILDASSIVALLITVRVMRIEVGEHILYSGLTVLLGLAPIGFLGSRLGDEPVAVGDLRRSQPLCAGADASRPRRGGAPRAGQASASVDAVLPHRRGNSLGPGSSDPSIGPPARLPDVLICQLGEVERLGRVRQVLS